MVIAEPEVADELLRVNTPVSPLRLVTPPPAPPVQPPKLKTPEALVFKQSPLLPSAVGKVNNKLLPVAPDCSVRVLPLLELLNTMAPVCELEVPRVRLLASVTAKVPVTVMALPDSVMTELVTLWAPLKTGMAPIVPPGVVTPVPEPAQLPRLTKQTVSELPPPMLGRLMVALPLPVVTAVCRIVRLLLEALARLSLPAVVDATPSVKPPPPWMATVPVKLAVELMVWPL